MTRYLISFDDGAMTFPEEDLPAVADAAHAVVDEAKAAGVWVLGAGVTSKDEVSVVATDGTVADGPESKAYVGGFSIVEVPTRDDALAWAAKIAVACRCAQEVRELMFDPKA
ncbi:MAG TPA: YciI family protein [Gaiellaceae bacterium]|nr:YciI family protein [Gaiellaceae bacterium]